MFPTYGNSYKAIIFADFSILNLSNMNKEAKPGQIRKGRRLSLLFSFSFLFFPQLR